MHKQLAVVIDASGSMFHPAGSGSSKDKIVEATESVQYMIDEIQNTATSSHPWAVSFWYFATQTKGITGQGEFPIAGGNTAIYKNLIDFIENQAAVNDAAGNLTDIFHAVRTVADFMVTNPPSGFPAVFRKKIVLFTDGNQTVKHDDSLTRGGYEFEQGISFAALLAGNGIALNAQGIGSDLLNYTLTDLVAQAEPFGSSSKVISTTPQYAADTSAALMTNSMKVVNNNGILPLRPVTRTPDKLLWEQFSLPTRALDANGEPTDKRVNCEEFEVDVDEITRELLLGLTWHHPGQPTIEARAPSGTLFRDGLNGAFEIAAGWMTALHVPTPEAGTWRVRVQGDPHYRPLRMNLMARSVCPEFDIRIEVDPFQLEPPAVSVVTATPLFEGKPAKGDFKALLSDFAGRTWPMEPQKNGSLTAKADFEARGQAPLRVELEGKIADGRAVDRLEFSSVQVGRPRDPRLMVDPDRFRRGQRYEVEVAIEDAEFSAATQIRFGAGIEVKRFTVLSQLAAVAEVVVAESATPGAREVLSFQPDAQTLTGITIEGEYPRIPPSFTGIISGLCFDTRGRLAAVILGEDREIVVDRGSGRLQSLLEEARDEHREVTILVDEQGRLSRLTVGE